MNVSIDPVPEFTPHELLDEGLDAATITCAARTCVPLVGVAADGEAVVAAAVAPLVTCVAVDDSVDVSPALG